MNDLPQFDKNQTDDAWWPIRGVVLNGLCGAVLGLGVGFIVHFLNHASKLSDLYEAATDLWMGTRPNLDEGIGIATGTIVGVLIGKLTSKKPPSESAGSGYDR